MLEIKRNSPDEIHERLKQVVEVEQTSWLWAKGDTPPFIPHLLPRFYGDGRALFSITTINQRPKYWVIRGDSGWTCGSDYGVDAPENAPDFGELYDEILNDLDEYFGRAACSYCGAGASCYANGAPEEAHCGFDGCERPDEVRAGCGWPSVDAGNGCSWSRMRWPDGFEVVDNPHHYRGNLLAAAEGETGHE
jgi:hypothetical protein